MSWKCFWTGLIVCVFFKYHSFFSSKNFFRTSGEPGGWLISTLHLRFSFFWGTSHFAVRLFDCLSCSQFRIKSQAWIFLRESFSFSQTGFRISKCKCLIQCLSFITKSQNVYYRIQNGNNIKYLFFFVVKVFFQEIPSDFPASVKSSVRYQLRLEHMVSVLWAMSLILIIILDL